jgi:ubiquinone/menaquinone biosynthesis C-methylase UbiE/glycosyltransferase involved in cell wall biosynthesis
MSSASHGQSQPVALTRIFGPASDDFWYWCLSAGRNYYTWLNDLLPGMPAEEVQLRFTGRSGEATLEQAYGFYQICKRELGRRGSALTPNSRILDFGCGWGRITRFFLKDVEPENLVAVDVLDEAVRLCRDTKLPCQVLKIQPAPPLPFADASFDTIIAYSVFSHLSEDYARVWMREFSRVLKRGGTLLATTRPREAVTVSAQYRAQGESAPGYARAAARSFRDPKPVLRAYDAGEFCFDPAGEALGLSGWFGEALIPKAYAQKNYADWYSEIEMLESQAHHLFDQNLLILRTPQTASMAPVSSSDPAAAPELPWTGERLVTSLHGPIVAEHLHRYALATELVSGKTVLDVACGEGYGSRLLAQRAARVIGVDVSAETINHAQAKYGGGNLSFAVGAAEKLPLADASVDTIVSFETIEHIGSPETFLTEIRRCLKPGGQLVISSPDKGPYNAANSEPNVFHTHELAHAEFLGLLRSRFHHVLAARQRFLTGSYLAADISGSEGRTGTFTGDFNGAVFSEGVPGGIYSVAVCSDAPLERIPFGIYETPLARLGGEGSASQAGTAHSEAERLLRDRTTTALSELWSRSRQEAAEARKHVDELAAEAQKYAAELAAAQADLQNRVAHLEGERSRAQGMAAELQREREDLHRRLDDLTAQAQLLRETQTHERASAQQEIAGLEAQHANAEQRVDAQIQYSQVLLEQLTQAKGQVVLLKERIDLLCLRLRTTDYQRFSLRLLPMMLKHVLVKWFAIALQKLRARVRVARPRLPLRLEALVLAAGEKVLGHWYARPNMRSVVAAAGLFDEDFYRQQVPDLKGRDPLRHYLRHGAFENLNPNAYFDTAYYQRQNPDVAFTGLHPFVHFITLGMYEERDPGPDFDTQYYLLNNSDVARAGVMPFVHFFRTGRGEKRLPKPIVGTEPDSSTDAAEPSAAAPLKSPFTAITRRAPRPLPEPPATDGRAKLVAFYLPQFHPVPENDAWWGPGFTEWDYVIRARPLFHGHHQPHLPADMGFYDLRLPEVREQQAAMARAYGIGAFCYYYYWFNGRKLLDRPLREIMESGRPDFPFCLCWANENWTRNWDGEDKKVLLEQKHSLESDLDFIEDVLPILQDPRYLRFQGKPVLLVYRVDRLTDPQATAQAWRERSVRAGLPGLHLCAVETVGFGDPRHRGFDALVEFPPNSYATDNIAWRLSGVHPEFRGHIAEYRDMLTQSLKHQPEYPYHRAVMGMWDNTPRRRLASTIFRHASPEAYTEWLRGHLDRARERGEAESLIFINAWNEWGEGAHLEPDRELGYAFLDATRVALGAEPGVETAPEAADPSPSQAAARQKESSGLALVVHDAHRHGAQYIALAIARTMHARQVPVHIILRQNGELTPEFERYGRVHVLPELIRQYGTDQAAFATVLDALGQANVHRAICNTVVTGAIASELKHHGFQVLGLVHELPTLIEALGYTNLAKQIAAAADGLIFPAQVVRDAFVRCFRVNSTPLLIRPQGVLRPNPYLERRAWARKQVAERHSLPGDYRLVINCGFGDLRKGPDLFLAVAKEVLRAPGMEHTHFAWLGSIPDEMLHWCRHDIAAAGLAGRIHLAGFQEDTALYMAAADVFALTSREDPFPTVNLEALEAGLPVVAFADAGGAPEILLQGAGVVVPYLDVHSMAEAVRCLLQDETRRRQLGACGAELIRRDYSLDGYVDVLLSQFESASAPVKPQAGKG